jgi:hypothetical protein
MELAVGLVQVLALVLALV